MAELVNAPTYGLAIADDGVPTLEMQNWMAIITDVVNATAPITGTGTPESNTIASIGRWYVDTAASVGTGIYFKQSGDGDTGWILRS